jgi:hypothetical protein
MSRKWILSFGLTDGYAQSRKTNNKVEKLWIIWFKHLSMPSKCSCLRISKKETIKMGSRMRLETPNQINRKDPKKESSIKLSYFNHWRYICSSIKDIVCDKGRSHPLYSKRYVKLYNCCPFLWEMGNIDLSFWW